MPHGNPLHSSRTFSWPLVALLILFPVWSLAIFGRGAWMPDEPREYNITLNMLHDANLAVPHMAGEPFLEKPPLLYWIGTSFMRLSGTSVSAARAQNLLWAAIVALAAGLLAGRMATTSSRPALVSLVAALASGTMVLLFEIQIWFSTDAPLLAATALIWLSAWEVTHCDEPRERLWWYVLFGGSLSAAFFAKNIFGWVTPGIGLVMWIVWERRWSVLRHAGLYACLAAVAAVIALWMWRVTRQADGAENLVTLLRDNSLGRFTAASSGGGYEFGHRNRPLRFVFLLPLFALPWTFCVGAALRWAWRELRQRTANVSAIRFVLCGFMAGVTLLMLSATARDTYFGPAILAMCPLLGLWAGQRQNDRVERRLLISNLLLTRIAAVLLVLIAFTVAILQDHPWLVGRIAVTLLVAVLCWLGWRAGRPMFAHEAVVAHLPIWLFAVLTLEVIAFPAIEAAENLSPLATHAAADIAGSDTLLFCGDETTRATLDTAAGVRLKNVCDRAEVEQLLRDHPQQRFLSENSVMRLSARTEALLHLLRASMLVHGHDRTMPAAQLEALGLRPLIEWSTPAGRSYGLYEKPPRELAAAVNPTLTENASRR